MSQKQKNCEDLIELKNKNIVNHVQINKTIMNFVKFYLINTNFSVFSCLIKFMGSED